MFLVDGEKNHENEIRDELDLAFSDYGWQMDLAAERLAEFKSVENTYLLIFMTMGSFGLLIGTFGLAVVLAKNLLERKKELAMLLVNGFSIQKINRLIFTEYSILLLMGIFTGFVSALIAVFPSLLTLKNLSVLNILSSIIGILIIGISSIGLITKIQIRRIKVIETLRNE